MSFVCESSGFDLNQSQVVSSEYKEGGKAVRRKDASERREASHANGASRRSGSRESVSGSPRGEAARIKRLRKPA